jgi:flavodoxin
MKAMVIYDAQYGNTAQIARSKADGLRGTATDALAVDLRKVGDVHPDQLAGLDLLLAGAPTHGSRPSPGMHDFLNRVPKDALAGVKVAAFDTRTDMDKLGGYLHYPTPSELAGDKGAGQ